MSEAYDAVIQELSDDTLLDMADNIMNQILDLARTLTPEGWDRARSYAMFEKPRSEWHTGDLALMSDVRLISMRGGTRYKPVYVPERNKNGNA